MCNEKRGTNPLVTVTESTDTGVMTTIRGQTLPSFRDFTCFWIEVSQLVFVGKRSGEHGDVISSFSFFPPCAATDMTPPIEVPFVDRESKANQCAMTNSFSGK